MQYNAVLVRLPLSFTLRRTIHNVPLKFQRVTTTLQSPLTADFGSADNKDQKEKIKIKSRSPQLPSEPATRDLHHPPALTALLGTFKMEQDPGKGLGRTHRVSS